MEKIRDIKPVEILLVEDNKGDARLAQETLKNSKISNKIHWVHDGVEAMKFLHNEGKYDDAPRPDVILLDLNLPKKDGREVLEEVKTDENLKRIPIVVLTVSDDERDILHSYNHHVNCYITKPIDLNAFTRVVKSIKEFWFSIVKLPPDKID